MMDYIVITTDKKGFDEVEKLKSLLKKNSNNVFIDHRHFDKPGTGIVIVNGYTALDVWKDMWKNLRSKIKLPSWYRGPMRPWGMSF
ncbi:MAG: hypothetical protein WC437_05180 [Patescibacteria group bacterium]|jgi:hypothetical protein